MHQSPVPQQLLTRQVIHAKRFAEVDVLDCLVEGESGGEEGDEKVAGGPRLDGLIEDDLVAKEDGFKVAGGDEPVEHVSTGF